MLASDTVFDVIHYITLDSRPSVAFLDSGKNFSNALVAHFVMCPVHYLMLVQLRHNNHARAYVQWSLCRYILYAKDVISVDKQQILFLVKVPSCKVLHVWRKDRLVEFFLFHEFAQCEQVHIAVLR